MFKVVLIASVASLAALAVFIGLWMEDYGEKEEYDNIEDFRRSKKRARAGMKWVKWGVFAECVLGFGVASWEGYETIKVEQKIHNITPSAQPVTRAVAVAHLKVTRGFIFDSSATNRLIDLSFRLRTKPELGFISPITMSLDGPVEQFDNLFVLHFKWWFLIEGRVLGTNANISAGSLLDVLDSCLLCVEGFDTQRKSPVPFSIIGGDVSLVLNDSVQKRYTLSTNMVSSDILLLEGFPEKK